MANLTPVKTEYKGIVFDSKSEAIFARKLDLDSINSENTIFVSWEYHPENFVVNNYCPDFLTQIYIRSDDDKVITKVDLIEYKPSVPTKTYINRLTGYFEYIKENDQFNTVRRLFICSGSVFDSIEFNVIELNCDLGGTTVNDITGKYGLFSKLNLNEARQYRFDLEHQQI